MISTLLPFAPVFAIFTQEKGGATIPRLAFLFPCRPLCQHTRTYVRSSPLQWLRECNLRNPFRPRHPPLIAVLLTPSAGGTGGKTDTAVITKTLLQPLQLKSYIGTNWDFFFSSLESKLNESVMCCYCGSGGLTGHSSHVTGKVEYTSSSRLFE